MDSPIRTLQEIGIANNCDKFTRHNFGPVYERFLSPLREKPIKILEIGIGGEDFASGGESLNTWQDYFPNAQIFGIDIYPKGSLDTSRIHTFVCSQTDRASLEALASEYGPFDVIIDDGSHHNNDAVVSFQVLFPSLRPGGIYAIEDVQTSYWANYGGSSIAPDCFSTSASWLKRCVDIINRGEMVLANSGLARADLEVGELHVFHNIAVLIRQVDPTSHLSRVLTPEMKADVAQVDMHRHGMLQPLFSPITEDPFRFGEILTAIAAILEGAQAGATQGAASSSPGSTATALTEVFTRYHEAVLNLMTTMKTQKDYISVLELDKTELMKAITDQTTYIATLEAQKAEMQTELLAHSKALKDYRASFEDMHSYIATLEQRGKQQ